MCCPPGGCRIGTPPHVCRQRKRLSPVATSTSRLGRVYRPPPPVCGRHFRSTRAGHCRLAVAYGVDSRSTKRCPCRHLFLGVSKTGEGRRPSALDALAEVFALRPTPQAIVENGASFGFSNYTI